MPTDSPRPIILDVDTGVDDAWALIYALRSPALQMLGITTGYGNADVETTTRNTLLLTELLGSDVPVYRGSSEPLFRPWDGPVPAIHGVNGLGDAPLPPLSRHTEDSDAAAFIRHTVRALPGRVTLVTVARLTNVARALLYDPALATLVERVICMGGAAFCPGNVSPTAEANIWGDPEAADLVFRSGIPITMVGLDVTHKGRLYQRDLSALDPALPYTALLRQATEFYIQAYIKDDPRNDGWCPLHDPLAVAVAEDPSLVRTERYPVRVEHSGTWTDGMTVVDARRGQTPTGVDVAVDLDVDRFMTLFRTRVGL